MSVGIHFRILLCQTNRQYLVWWTVSVTQEACRTETVPVDLRCYVTIVWTISVKLCYALHGSYWENFIFRVDYPMEVYIRQTEHVSGMGCVTFQSPCIYVRLPACFNSNITPRDWWNLVLMECTKQCQPNFNLAQYKLYMNLESNINDFLKTPHRTRKLKTLNKDPIFN
jgi:hypothetical protein